MKVNMTPNPLDVVTIHASQGDSEARQWEFELHNNGELIDTSEVTEQMVFKAYKGGTEQILPENTSTPTTSPFLGDIKYPQGELTDQEFTYRQSPTEEDGLAKITDVKGNTLVWNQLVQNGNFASASGWTSASSDFNITIGNDMATLEVVTPKASAILQGNVLGTKVDHFYYTTADLKYDVAPTETVFVGSGGYDGILKRVTSANTWVTIGGLFKRSTGGNDVMRIYPRTQNMTVGDKIYVRNVMVIDLTAIFGADKALAIWQMEQRQSGSGVAYFRSLFSLPYYAYNQGSLLSFMGNGIKTTGANNMFGVGIRNNTNWIYQNASNRAILEFDVEPSTQYTIKIDYSSNIFQATVIFKEGYVNYQIANRALGSGVKEFTVTTQSNCRVLCIQFESNASITFTDNDFPNRNSWYCLKDPSQISTLSLPISTYFPTGMKSAGNVYDELTENKAITRVGNINFDDYTWSYNPDYGLWVSNLGIEDGTNGRALKNANIPFQIIQLDGNALGSRINNTYNIWVRNGSSTVAPSGLAYYELATPTETSFTTASLVTENAEIPLSNNDGTLIGKCTEQLSENPGFIDAKIKLTDSDGECYSNKIQLHVERSPQ